MARILGFIVLMLAMIAMLNATVFTSTIIVELF